MDQMEEASQSSMAASSQDIERLGDIFRQVGGDIDSSIQRMIEQEEELARQTKDTAEEGSSLSTAFSAVGTVLAAAGAAIAATATAIGVLVQTTTAAIVETDNYAQAVGISTEAMQAFQFAAQRVGGDTDALRESLRTSQDAVAQFVNDGTGPAAEALEVFGLQLTDSAGKVRSMEQLLPELTAALGNVQDPAERSRLAIQLFGEEDSRVMLALANNPTILAESTAALESYGLVMGDDLVQQSRAFQTGLTDVMAALQGLAQELVSALLPTLNALLPQFTAWVVSLRESDAVQKELIPTIQAIIGYLAQVGVAVDVLKAGWAALNAGFNAAVMVILEGVGKIAQGLGTVITAAGTAADVLGMDGVADKLRSAGAAVTAVGNEADKMGDIARENMNEWQKSLDTTIARLGSTTTATQQTTTATQELGKAATAAGKQVTEASKAMAEETAKAQTKARELREAYIDLGIKSGAALKKMADEAVADFQTIRDAGTETPKRLAALWVDEIVPKIIEAYGKIPPALAEYDRLIRAGTQQTVSMVDQAFKNLGVSTKAELDGIAAQSLVDFQLVAAYAGVNSTEAAQAWSTAKQDILAAYGEIPPGLQDLNRRMSENSEETATSIATSHQQAVQQIVAVYSDGFTRINGIIQATTGVIENGGFQWGQTMEELQEQLARTRTEYNNWSRAVGVPLDVAEFQMRRLNDIINELQGRIRELSESEREARGSTDDLATSARGLSDVLGSLTIRTSLFGKEVELVRNRFGEWRPRIDDVIDGLEETNDRTTTLTSSLGGAGSAIQSTTAALGTLVAAQAALNDVVREGNTLGAGAAVMRPTTRTGGTGTGGTGSGGPGTGTGSTEGNGDSVVIGQGPPQLPQGTPLPSDLGLPGGGTSSNPYGTSLSSRSLTQNTVINVNEPITVQTRADSSTVTAEAVVQALNDGIRRGIIRPELGSSLR